MNGDERRTLQPRFAGSLQELGGSPRPRLSGKKRFFRKLHPAQCSSSCSSCGETGCCSSGGNSLAEWIAAWTWPLRTCINLQILEILSPRCIADAKSQKALPGLLGATANKPPPRMSMELASYILISTSEISVETRLQVAADPSKASLALQPTHRLDQL